MGVLACACCGHLTVIEEYDICPVCFWEADGAQKRDPTFAGGANEMNLIEAREAYGRIGAISEKWAAHVRPPLAHEIPPSN